jgi:hypothetical protein
LTIPIPPLGVRPHTRRIEDALTALYQIDYVLEVRMDELGMGGSRIPLDIYPYNPAAGRASVARVRPAVRELLRCTDGGWIVRPAPDLSHSRHLRDRN